MERPAVATRNKEIKRGHKSALIQLLLFDWCPSVMKRDGYGIVQNRWADDDFKLTSVGRDLAIELLKEQMDKMSV